MSSQFLSLEEAAKRLGISTDRMVELRSEGKIRGFRDGASWKFPENELDRLVDELAASSDNYNPYGGFGVDELASDDPSTMDSGSGVLVDELDLGSDIGSPGSVIGGDSPSGISHGSDVNLIVDDSDGSDVKIVSGNTPVPSDVDEDDFLLGGDDGGLVEIDSGELQLPSDEPAIGHDSEMLDLAFDDDDDDSGEDLIGSPSNDVTMDSDLDMGAVTGGKLTGASSLELMDDLDLIGGSDSLSSSRSSRSVDVLSELDLLNADAGGSGLITGDSGPVLGSGFGKGKKSSVLDFDDALSDDDLVIEDDEDDLVLGGSASDVSVSGDSGINLMAPSDSGLSLESEPLDLAASSISALDLGAELGSGIGSGPGSSKISKGSRASGLDVQGDEDFRLSPSSLGIEGDGESNSQVIEIEDSDAFAGEDAFGDSEFGEAMPVDGGFSEDAVEAVDGFGDEAVEVDDDMAVGPSRARAGATPIYEVPFSIFQVSMLMLTLSIMCLGGMLMTDLMRNMWAYTDTTSPVSSLTDSLISLANLDG